MTKNILLAVAGTALAALVIAACGNAKAKLPLVVVYKSPTCGCCEKWMDHMRSAGFQVKVSEVQDVEPMKRRHNVPEDARSCHTALVDGYVVEGHVPAEDVIRMLDTRPDIDGIATPGMPMGSPGMEGDRRDSYTVVAFVDGTTSYAFASH